MTGPSLRSLTTIRFAVLIAAVLASSTVAFGVLFTASPAATRLSREINRCMARSTAATEQLPTDVAGLNVRRDGVRACTKPLIIGEAVWVAYGLGAEVVVAGLLYGLHPWWLTRRRRLTRLDGDPDTGDVRAELDDLAHQAGLTGPPVWLLAPYAPTQGGQAFGLPGRRRISLDVGLLARFDTDRPGFRAVVRHELAHLHNRDVGRTYLTIAAWWSFVTVALLPFLAVTLKSNLLREPLSPHRGTTTDTSAEALYRLGTVLALTAIVYLARNAVLRTREAHADFTAAGWDDPDGALTRVVTALPWPTGTTRGARLRRAWARLGTHPHPSARAAAVADARRLTRPGLWDMTGLGLLLGLTFNNITLLAGGLLGAYLLPGMVLIALPFGVALVALLAVAVIGVTQTASGGPRTALLLSGALAAGLTVSKPVSLLSARNPGLGDTPTAFLLVSALYLAGAVLLGAWVFSAYRALAEPAAPTNHPRWWSWMVAGTAVVFGAPLFAVGNPLALPYDILTVVTGGLPVSGWAIGWYVALAKWIGLLYLPLEKLANNNPFFLVGIVGLGAVPITVLARRRKSGAPPIGAGRALAVGAIAGMAIVSIGLLLPYAARAALPLDVRQVPTNLNDDFPAPDFRTVYGHTYRAMAVLTQAVAAAVIAAWATRLRPVLVPLTVLTTAVIATQGFYVSRALANHLGVFGKPRQFSVSSALPDQDVGFILSMMLAWGIVAAIPAGLLGAGLGALWRRRRPSRPVALASDPRPGANRATITAVGLLGAAVLAATTTLAPDADDRWMPDPVPAAAAIPLPAAPTKPISSAVDRCVLGTWRETLHQNDSLVVGEKRTRFTSSGITQTFRPDGTATVNYDGGTPLTATVDGQHLSIVVRGRGTIRFRSARGTITYRDGKGTGTQTLKINGTVRSRSTLRWRFDPDHYTCNGDTMRQTPATPGANPYLIILHRTAPAD
jgi:Zn-dependent protease with chaperone function